MAPEVDACVIDGKSPERDVVLGPARRLDADAVERNLVHVEPQSKRPRVGAEIIIAVEGQDARVDLEGQTRAQVAPETARLEIRDLELAVRGERSEPHGAAPLEPLALRRGCFQDVSVSGRGGGAEVAQLEGDRGEIGAKRRLSGTILEGGVTVDQLQPADVQAHGLRFRRRLRRRRKALAEVGEIELS